MTAAQTWAYHRGPCLPALADLPDGAAGLVVDPFAGIASAGVAALLEGCSYWGAEVDPQWWPVAESRLAAAVDNTHGLGLFEAAS